MGKIVSKPKQWSLDLVLLLQVFRSLYFEFALNLSTRKRAYFRFELWETEQKALWSSEEIEFHHQARLIQFLRSLFALSLFACMNRRILNWLWSIELIICILHKLISVLFCFPAVHRRCHRQGLFPQKFWLDRSTFLLRRVDTARRQVIKYQQSHIGNYVEFVQWWSEQY